MFKLTSKQKLAYLSATGGIIQLILSYPVGRTTDTLKRQTVILLACAVGLVAVAVSITSVRTENWHFMLAGSALWGIFNSLILPPMEALFADSVPTGRTIFNFKSVVFLFVFLEKCIQKIPSLTCPQRNSLLATS